MEKSNLLLLLPIIIDFKAYFFKMGNEARKLGLKGLNLLKMRLCCDFLQLELSFLLLQTLLQIRNLLFILALGFCFFLGFRLFIKRWRKFSPQLASKARLASPESGKALYCLLSHFPVASAVPETDVPSRCRSAPRRRHL